MTRTHTVPRVRHVAPRPESPSFAARLARGKFPLLAAAALLAILLWNYWRVAVVLFKEWQTDQNYSVGELVPLAALYLLWQERHALARCRVAPSWWGVVLLLLALGARLLGILYLFESAERYALVMTVAGLVLLVAGRQVFWRIRWILLFLALMVPLPGRVHNLISGPLQTWATTGTVFVLELFGVTVGREGNVIVLNDVQQVAIAEACSGLRMLTAFVVVASVFAYVVNRPRWQKLTLVVSSVPLAVLCNLTRLVLTAVLYLVVSSAAAERFFHDFAGLSMMPLAVLLLIAELKLMAWLVTPDQLAKPTAAAGGRA
jgi:exosortase